MSEPDWLWEGPRDRLADLVGFASAVAAAQGRAEGSRA